MWSLPLIARETSSRSSIKQRLTGRAHHESRRAPGCAVAESTTGVAQDRLPQQDRRHRRLQLVSDHREELVAQPVRTLRLFERPAFALEQRGLVLAIAVEDRHRAAHEQLATGTVVDRRCTRRRRCRVVVAHRKAMTTLASDLDRAGHRGAAPGVEDAASRSRRVDARTRSRAARGLTSTRWRSNTTTEMSTCE